MCTTIELLFHSEYKAVVPNNLFTAFEAEAPGNNIAHTFTPWTEQSGYPLVTAERKGTKISLTQKRFLLEPQTDETRWTIPLTIAVSAADFNSTATQAVFPRDKAEYVRDLPEGDLGFYILNVQQVGYYRVNYDAENWEAIRRALHEENYGGIHVLNRAQIVDDLFNLAQAEEVNYNLVFEVTDFLTHETNYIPWLSAFNGLSYLSRRIANNDDSSRFETHILYLLDRIYTHLGFQPKANEAHIDTLNRVNVLSWACKHGHPDCITEAKAEFARLVQGTNYRVHPDIRVPVYCVGVREGGQSEFDFLWRKYTTSNVAHEQNTILQALGCTKQVNLVNVSSMHLMICPIPRLLHHFRLT